jgi:hypothetical protein
VREDTVADRNLVVGSVELCRVGIERAHEVLRRRTPL